MFVRFIYTNLGGIHSSVELSFKSFEPAMVHKTSHLEFVKAKIST